MVQEEQMPTDGLLEKRLDIQDVAPSNSRPKRVHVWHIWFLLSAAPRLHPAFSTSFVLLQQRSKSLRYSRFYFPPPPMTTEGGGKGDSANRVGDIRLHFQGVEGIELPQFPHLRRTEARNQCNQCCLSEPLIHAVRHASFRSPLYSHLYTLQRSCSHLFLHVTSFSPISFTLVVLPSC